MKGVDDDVEAALEQMEERYRVDPDPVRGVFTRSFGTYEIDPETLEVIDEPSDAETGLPVAVIADAEQRGTADGLTAFTDEEVADFERRLEAAVDAVANGDLTPDAVVTYIAGRWNGDLPPGEAGVTEHFGEDVSKADVDRVWEFTMEAA